MGVRSILLVTDAFPPDFAPRMGYLCKYLVLRGWHVHVLVSDMDHAGQQQNHLVGFGTVHSIPRKKHNKLDDFLLRVKLRFIGIAIPFADTRAMLREADKIIQQHRPDLVLTSSYTTYPLPQAAKIVKKHNLPLVADLRDIQEEWPRKNWRYRLYRGAHLWYERIQRNSVLRQAAAVITVSPWHQEFISQFNPECHLIYNGYDPELFGKTTSAVSSVFRIVYAGTIGSLSLRNPDFLFAAVKKLHKLNKIAPENFVIEFYCEKNATAMLEPLAEKFDIKDFVSIKAYRPQPEIPKLLANAQLLLLLANRSDNNGSLKGVMTTKFFEYLAVNRPILLTRSDEDCLEKTILELNAGVAARTENEAFEYLCRLLEEWQRTGRTAGRTDMNKVTHFSRQSEADEFIRLFSEVLGTNYED